MNIVDHTYERAAYKCLIVSEPDGENFKVVLGEVSVL